MGYRAAECLVDGCGWHLRTHQGYCHGHYQRLRKHGDVMAHTPIISKRRLKKIIVMPDRALVPLTQGMLAVVDVADIGLVSGRNWHAVKDGHTYYALASGSPKTKMHEIILGARVGCIPDHIDGDGLNNRKGNLRFATDSQNQYNKRPSASNKTGLKGVREATWATGPKRWRANIFIEGKPKHLGYFYSPEEAAMAYDTAASAAWGEYARLNMGRA
jgi:hypothetical protein